MNSKIRGLSPFKGTRVDRIPMWYAGAEETTKNIINYLCAKTKDEALYDILGIDYKYLSPKYIGKPMKKYDDGSFDTIWGIRRGGYHYGQALNHPLSFAESYKDIDKYSFPDNNDWDFTLNDDELRKVKDFCVMSGTGSPFFHDTIELMGMEKFMLRMYDNPAMIEALIERCVDFYFEMNRRFYEVNQGAFDFVMWHNDFGSQNALLMSPTHWRKFFKPQLLKLVNLAHKHNILVALHSCGDIHEIIPDIIEIGVDALNPIQVSAANMDPVILEKEYGEDIVFFGAIDENEILLHGSEERVREETRRIIDIFGKNGKYIVAASHDFLLPEVPAKNICAMYNEARSISRL